ncbi:hypothetical protein QTP70_018820, partial [Hemibagrus guttatus]
MIGEVFCDGAPPEAEVFGSIRRAGDRGRAETESGTGTEFGNVLSVIPSVYSKIDRQKQKSINSPSKKIPDSGVDFYKDDSILQNQTTGEMTISSVSKSDEGFYHCKHPERGESPKSWVSVRVLSYGKAATSVLKLLSSVVTASVYVLVTIILAVKCYRAR